MVYPTSWESDDETSAASTYATPIPSSTRQTSGLVKQLFHSFGSPGRSMESLAKLEVLETMVE